MNVRTKRRLATAIVTATVLVGTGVMIYQLKQTEPDGSNASLDRLAEAQPLRAGESTQTATESEDPSTLDAIAAAWAHQPAVENDADGLESQSHSLEPAPAAAAPAQATNLGHHAETHDATTVDSHQPDDPPTQSPNAPAPVTPSQDPVTPSQDNDTLHHDISMLGDRYSSASFDSSEFPTTESVARGQEPYEGDTYPAEEPTDSPVGTQLQNEPAEEVDEESQDEALERARAAFENRPSPAGGGRYGSSGPKAEAANPAPVVEEMENPFARRQPAPVPAAAASARPIDASGGPAPETDHHPGAAFGTPGSYGNASPPRNVAPPAAGPPESNTFSRPPESNRFQLPESEDRFDRSRLQPQHPPNSLPANGNEDNLPSRPATGLEHRGNRVEGIGRPGEQALEGPQRPALEIQKFAPEEIQVGKVCTFRMVVRNVGNRPADNVVVRDQVPQGTRLMDSTPRAETSEGQVVWQLGTLSSGEQREFEMQLMPVAEGEIGSVAQVTFAAQASAKTHCTLPQLAIRMTAPRTVMIGQEQRVKIELHNPGTGDATGVMLFENVPDELAHQAGHALEFEVGTLRAGETRQMELVLTAEKPGLVRNRVTASADGNLQVEQEIEFDVISPALEIGVEGPRLRYLERPATYSVSVRNPGTAAAKDIELVTKLPKGMRFVRANNLGEYDSTSHAVYWSLAELPEGELGTVELVTLPVESGEHEIQIEGKAGQGLEDRTTQHVLVEGLAAIMFTVVDLEDPIEVGGETTYEIRVLNQGTKAATGVQVTAALPPAMQVVSATGETRHSIQNSGVVFEPISSLAPKAEVLYRIQVQGAQPGDQRIHVEVDSDDIGEPIRKEESTRVFGEE